MYYISSAKLSILYLGEFTGLSFLSILVIVDDDEAEVIPLSDPADEIPKEWRQKQIMKCCRNDVKNLSRKHNENNQSVPESLNEPESLFPRFINGFDGGSS